MNKINNFIQKVRTLFQNKINYTYLFIGGLILIIILFVTNKLLDQLGSYSRKRNLPSLQEDTIQNPQAYSLEIDKITLNAVIEIPTEAPVFTPGESGTLQQVCEKFANTQQLSPSQKIAETNVWKSDTQSLYCNYSENILTWSQPSSLGPPPDSEQSKENTRAFLSSIDLTGIAKQTPTEQSFFSQNLTLMPAYGNSNVLKLSYTEKKEEYEVYQAIGGVNKLVVFTDGTNAPFKMEYYHQSSVGESAGIYPLANLQEATTRLNNGEGTIVRASFANNSQYYDNPVIGITSLESATLSITKIVYVYSSKNQLYFPAYLITGNGITENKQRVALEIILPAINEDYFTSSSE